jgi:hypothetical protein
LKILAATITLAASKKKRDPIKLVKLSLRLKNALASITAGQPFFAKPGLSTHRQPKQVQSEAMSRVKGARFNRGRCHQLFAQPLPRLSLAPDAPVDKSLHIHRMQCGKTRLLSTSIFLSPFRSVSIQLLCALFCILQDHDF